MVTFYKKLTLLTLILTSFILWVIFSEEIRKSIVKNIIKKDEVTTYINKNKNNVSRSNIFTNKLEEVWILEKEKFDLTNFWDIYWIIKKDFYDVEWIKKQDLIDWAAKWLVDSLWDKHSSFLSKKENKDFNKMLSWDFEWIGAFVDKLSFWVNIERVLKWSPAEKYWVRNNDVVIEANWEKLEWLSLYESVSKIKWPKGTKVLLKILRKGERESIEIEVIRWSVRIPAIEEKYFKELKLGYISLNNVFGNNVAREFSKSLKNLEEKNIEGLIIDLRNNWGWLLLWAVEILSEFIEKDKLLVTTKYKNKSNEVYSSLYNHKRFNKKIVVIINEWSASASEITSLALREYNKAILVGEKSYWKWSVQKPFELNNWSMLKLTISKWFTPQNKNIDWIWIKPDIKIEIKKEDYNFKECIKVWNCKSNLEEKDFKIYDRQLEESKKILKSFIKKWNLQVVIDEENERLWNEVEEIEEKK